MQTSGVAVNNSACKLKPCDWAKRGEDEESPAVLGLLLCLVFTILLKGVYHTFEIFLHVFFLPYV